MALRAENEILATTVKLCSLVRHNREWYFVGDFARIKSTAEGILSFSRLFHRQKDSLRDGGNSEF